ncbi:MAG: hypothetical protein ACR2PR_04210 [Pseudohongiellaceae bacterium]
MNLSARENTAFKYDAPHLFTSDIVSNSMRDYGHKLPVLPQVSKPVGDYGHKLPVSPQALKPVRDYMHKLLVSPQVSNSVVQDFRSELLRISTLRDTSNLANSIGLRSMLKTTLEHAWTPQNRQAWVQKLESRFQDLLALQSGWDGYTGCSVSPTVVNFAIDLLQRLYVEEVPEPQMVPGSDGTLQLEWHLNNYDLEIDILAPHKIIATLFDHTSGDEEEIEVGEDFTRLARWVSMLGSERVDSQPEEGKDLGSNSL